VNGVSFGDIHYQFAPSIKATPGAMRAHAALQRNSIAIMSVWNALRVGTATPVPVGNSILLATDIESGDAPALCEGFVA
jgi:hypothetical protein